MRALGVVILGLPLVAVGAAEISPQLLAERPGAVKPEGWIRNWALAAKAGFTGHLEELDEHFRIAWTTNCMRRGELLQWYDKTRGSWSAEGGAYWFDGLARLAWQLDDEELKALCRRRMDTLLERMNANAVGFLWWMDRRNPAEQDEVFKRGNWQIEIIGGVERALGAYYEASGDRRVLRALEWAFDYPDMARRFGWCGGFASGIYDAWRLTGSEGVAKCLDIACSRVWDVQYTKLPWARLEDTLNLKRVHERQLKLPSRHGVAAYEQLIALMAVCQRTGNRKLCESIDAWLEFFERHCEQPSGVIVADEEWGWKGAYRGTETCVVAAGMAARLKWASLFAGARHADAVERMFFNAGAAAVAGDFRRHVYFQLPNRLGVGNEAQQCSSHARETTTRYLDKHWPLCCSASLNRIIPYYVQGMWMQTADGGVAAVLYGPSSYATTLPTGKLELTERTDYPFAEQIGIAVTAAPGGEFPLKLRLPAWCAEPAVKVNGKPVPVKSEAGFAVLRREWRAGDEVALTLPMRPTVSRWQDQNDGARARLSISQGPLLFAYPVPALDDNTPLGTPAEPELADSLTAAEISVQRSALPKAWGWDSPSPVKLALPAANGERLELVPYGGARLRVSAFPVTARSSAVPAAKGDKVEILHARMRDFYERPRWQRMGLMLDPEFRAAAKQAGSEPKPFVLPVKDESRGGTLELFRESDGEQVRTLPVTGQWVRLDNLEVATRYRWQVKVGDRAVDSGRFETEDGVPRICRIDKVGNVRDLGGRRTADGRRVKQGLIYRSATFNHTADTPKDNRAKWRMGPSKLSAAAASEALATFRFKTDLDLRTEEECYGMTGSPLGSEVKWIRIRSSNYASMKEKNAMQAFAADFRVLNDPANLPAVFHCGGGADRTGSLAWLLEGILGMELDDMYRDWELTVFDYDKLKFNHWNFIGAFTRMLDEAYPQLSPQAQCVAYAKACGITDEEIAHFRQLLLE